jgi:transposase-like protein
MTRVRYVALSVRWWWEHVFVKVAERREARRLRSDDGLPIKEIARRLDVAVSTVSLWVRDIELTAEQHAALDARNPIRSAQVNGTEVRRRRCREQRIAAQMHGRSLARTGDLLHLQGCMLYWAEGTKSRNAAQLVNTDADLVGTFLRFLRNCYDVMDNRVAFSVNCFLRNGLSLDEIHAWWLARLDLPTTCLRKAVVNRPSSASKRLKGNILPYGTARLAVHSTFIVQSIYGAIQEYAGIDRPEWLDL